MVPFFVLTFLLVGVVALGGGESLAAVAALAGVALYYVVLWLLRDKVKHRIEFIITKQIK